MFKFMYACILRQRYINPKYSQHIKRINGEPIAKHKAAKLRKKSIAL